MTNEQANIKFIEDPLDCRIKIEGYEWNLNLINAKVEQLINKGREQTIISKFIINKDIF